ncbi:MAG: hypothetical protein H5U40_11640, partial [Polyangiaceae bacterium]|nr:hypothetical protein [Polyangiaceae bacterium]
MMSRSDSALRLSLLLALVGSPLVAFAQPAPETVEEDLTDEDLLDELTEELDEEPTAPASRADAERTEAPDDELGEPDALTLPEAVVAYTQEDVFRTGGGVSLVGQEELETFEYSDPNSVLLRVPGVYVRSEDGFGLR